MSPGRPGSVLPAAGGARLALLFHSPPFLHFCLLRFFLVVKCKCVKLRLDFLRREKSESEAEAASIAEEVCGRLCQCVVVPSVRMEGDT